ncbi:MAG: TRAP transporter large permease subunit [Paracoccaceae bacterium]
MLQKSKIAEDLLVTMAQLFGPVPGGLGISVVFVGALLAATTGIVGATVVAMGLISLPAMMRSNYSTPLATGTIAASGTLGQIIPPSIVLIILADQLATATDQAGVLRKSLYKSATGEFSMPSVFDVGSTSAGEMFLGALVPGMVLVGIYMVYILLFAMARPKSAPAIHYGGKFDGAFWLDVALALIPPLTLIFLVLGSILTGVATVNQAGAIGAVGALVMAGYRLTDNDRTRYWPAVLGIISVLVLSYAVSRFNMNIKRIVTSEDVLGIAIGTVASLTLIISLVWSGVRVFKIENTLKDVSLDTAKTTSLVFVILMGASILTASFRAFGGEDLVRDFLNGLPGGFWSKFIVVMGVIFVLGFFLDFIEIAVVVVPIVAPILMADPSANITAVWLGVMIGLNIQTSFLTPPFGFALFYLRGVAPAVVKTVDIYKGVIPFICLQLIALAIVGMSPSLVNYLPNRVTLLASTAPPPKNPRLQYCLDQYADETLAGDSGATLAAIKTAQTIDLTVLPKKLAKDVGKAIDDAEAAIGYLEAAFVAEKAVKEATPVYRPHLTAVRDIEKEIRRAEKNIKALKLALGQTQGGASKKQIARNQQRLVEVEADLVALKSQMPADWPDIYSAFNGLVKTEAKARQSYRRAGDNAHDSVAKVLRILDANADFAALEGELDALRTVIETAEPADAIAQIKALEKKLSRVAGSKEIKSPLSKVRRALKKKKPAVDKALKELTRSLDAFAAQKVWRVEADTRLRAGLTAFLDAINPTLGARSQSKLSREQALFLAWCGSGHTDISLQF